MTQFNFNMYTVYIPTWNDFLDLLRTTKWYLNLLNLFTIKSVIEETLADLTVNSGILAVWPKEQSTITKPIHESRRK